LEKENHAENALPKPKPKQAFLKMKNVGLYFSYFQNYLNTYLFISLSLGLG